MPRISKKRSISPKFSLYNNRGDYDNGADYFTGDLIYYAGDWWHCYDSAHLSPGYPPPSRPGNFVQITFKNKIFSKTTEVKNLDAQIQILKTQKVQLEANNQSTTQVQTQLNQKQNTLTKNVVKVETKVNAVAKKEVEVKVAQALGSIRENESGYGIVLPSLMGSSEISFNTSIYHRFGTSYSDIFIFGYAGTNYFGYKFVLFKGENAIIFLESSFQFANTTDSRGQYRYSNSTGTGTIRTNWSKYKRSSSWCLYDAENDIMYYSNYSGSYIPTKKWYRPDTLHKTEIELKIRSISSSGSGSGSGSSGTGGGVGISVLDSITNDADKIIWDYANDRFEPYGNYLLKSVINRPLISTEIENIFNDGTANYSIIYPSTGIILSDGGNPVYLNSVYVKPQQYSINSSSTIPLYKGMDLIPNGVSPSPNFVSVVPTYSDTEAAVAAIQKYGHLTGLYFYNQNYKAERRTPKKLLPGPNPAYYEMYGDGKIYKVQGSASSSAIKYANYSTYLNILTGLGDTVTPFTLFATGAYDMFAGASRTVTVLKQNNNIEISYPGLGRRLEHQLPNSLTKEDVKNIVLNQTTYPVDAKIRVLDNSGNLYYSNTLTSDNSTASWQIQDTGVRQITYNEDWGLVAITNNFVLKKYDQNWVTYPSGEIVSGNKYRLISPKYAIRHFE